MKKILAFLLLSTVFFATASAQHTLMVHEEGGNIYLTHTVVPKENWYSVGRIYNISPREMAPFNGLTIEHPLAIGQELKVPLNTINFSQNGVKNADETFVPVYHTAKGNENLSNISATYNKVPIANLEKWNKIKKDGVKEGMRLIVGYLKVKSSLSYLANEGVRSSEVAATTPNKPDVEEPKKETPKPLPTTEKPQEKTVKQEPTTPPTKTENKPIFTSNNSTNNHYAGGYFAPEYNDANNRLNGLAGTFKSTSGWNDGKYYVLINNIPVGTIVKVIAPATQKSVFAKVLGQLPDMKESESLTIRISNAAAAELGEGEGKFNVLVNY